MNTNVSFAKAEKHDGKKAVINGVCRALVADKMGIPVPAIDILLDGGLNPNNHRVVTELFDFDSDKFNQLDDLRKQTIAMAGPVGEYLAEIEDSGDQIEFDDIGGHARNVYEYITDGIIVISDAESRIGYSEEAVLNATAILVNAWLTARNGIDATLLQMRRINKKMGRPTMKSEERRVPVTYRLKPDIAAWLKKQPNKTEMVERGLEMVRSATGEV